MSNQKRPLLYPLYLNNNRLIEQAQLNKPLSQLLLSCLLGLMVASAYAAPPIAVVTNIDEPFDLNPFVETIEDPHHDYTLEDIQAGKYDHLWVRNQARHFIAHNLKSKYWFRLAVSWQVAESTAGFIYFDNQPSLIYRLGVAMPSGHGKPAQLIKTGFREHRSGPEMMSQRYVIPIDWDRGQIAALYGWLDNSETAWPAALPLYLVSLPTLNAKQQQIDGIQIAFYSVMSALLFYNLCLFFSLRQTVYGLYLGFLIAAIYECAVIDGNTLRWLWPGMPQQNVQFANMGGSLMAISYLAFVVTAINSFLYWPWFKKIYHALLAAGLMILCFSLLAKGNALAAILVQGFAGVLMPVMLLLIMASMMKRIPTASYLLIAELCMLIGSSSHMLMLQGVLPINTFTLWSLHAGMLCEVLLLSLALAARTRLAQQSAIENLKKYEIIYKLAAAAEKDRASAEARNQSKSQFFASMSHELRTPLTAILGYAETARGKEVSLEQKEIHIETIERGGKHLLQLINDILDLSKIEAQQLDVENIAVDVIELLRDVEDYFALLAMRKGLYFNIDYQFPLPAIIMSDPTRLKQTLINVCGNAVKFTENGGVTVSAACDQHQQCMIFAVKDTGIGLKPDQVEKLFNAFTQADAATTRNFGGTGLGLYLSKQIVEKLGGDIKVESQYGLGSIFTVTVAMGDINNASDTSATNNSQWLTAFPIARSRSKTLTIAPLQIPLLSGHILYAEENSQNQELVSMIVKQTGCTIDVVGNGQKALSLLQHEKYDLLFTDIRLPSIDGVELCATILKTQPQLPVIAVAATATENELTEFTAAGFKQILLKPIDRKMLYAAMREYLPARTFNGSDRSTQAIPIIRVLLAEDNLDNQAMIDIQIKRAGAACIIANDGMEAIAEVLKGEIDLILMDMQMPNMDGMTAVRYLRSKGFKKPIYALTADESAQALQACADAGCDGHLAKPLDAAKLNQVIQNSARSIQE